MDIIQAVIANMTIILAIIGAAGICCSMAEYVLLDMSGRERSKLVSILDYEWISIRHTKDARTADTSQFWNCREHWSVGT